MRDLMFIAICELGILFEIRGEWRADLDLGIMRVVFRLYTSGILMRGLPVVFCSKKVRR